MSSIGDFRRLAEVLDAKTTLNAQNLIKSLITFPDDLNLTGEEQVLHDPTNNMDLDDQHSGILTPIRNDRSSSSSPSLSLPDSFDVDVFEATKVKKAVSDTHIDRRGVVRLTCACLHFRDSECRAGSPCKPEPRRILVRGIPRACFVLIAQFTNATVIEQVQRNGANS
jgi:hypothetical protein